MRINIKDLKLFLINDLKSTNNLEDIIDLLYIAVSDFEELKEKTNE